MSDSPSRPRGAFLGLAALLLAVHALLAWKLRAAGISTGQDDAVYLLLGRGLRDFTYSNYWLVGSPPQATYPPLYPLVLGLADGIFGHGLTPALVLSVLFSTLGLAILFLIAYRWSPPAAFLTLSVSAVNPSLVGLAGQVFTEPMYMFCVALTLWFLAVPASSTRSRFWAGAMAIAAFLGRIIGIAMIAAVLLHWLIERRYRTALIFGIASLLCVGGWFIRARAAAGTALPGQSYILDALSTRVQATPGPDSVATAPAPAPAAPTSPVPSPPVAAAETDSTPASDSTGDARGLVTSIPAFVSVILRRVISNGPAYLSRGVPSVLAFPTIPGTTLDNWLWLVVILGLGALGLLELGRRLPGAAIYLACYAGILLVWPYTLHRFLAPVIPLLLLTMFLGLGRLVRRRTGFRAWALPSILGLLLVGSGFSQNRRELAALARCDRTAPYASEGCYDPVERAFFEAVWEADREAPRDAVFMSPKMATLYLLTGRRSIDELQAVRLGPMELRQHLMDRGVKYILFSRIHRDQMWLSDHLQSFCAEWELRAEYVGGALLLRRIDEPAPEPTPSSCEAVSRFVRGPW